MPPQEPPAGYSDQLGNRAEHVQVLMEATGISEADLDP
jgi:hypothetical protein